MDKEITYQECAFCGEPRRVADDERWDECRACGDGPRESDQPNREPLPFTPLPPWRLYA